MNLRLDVVVKDIVGLTGLKIIQEICNGEIDGQKSAKLRHGNCKKSEIEIAKALQSNKRQDFLFALKQELNQYQYIQNLIRECDIEIKALLDEFINQDEVKKSLHIDKKGHKRVNKNTPKNIDLNLMAYQYSDGIHLYAIEGFSHGTVLTLMSELGENGIEKFIDAQHFASWLRLAPNNKISGGRILSSRTPKGSNRLKIGLGMLSFGIPWLFNSMRIRKLKQFDLNSEIKEFYAEPGKYGVCIIGARCANIPVGFLTQIQTVSSGKMIEHPENRMKPTFYYKGRISVEISQFEIVDSGNFIIQFGNLYNLEAKKSQLRSQRFFQSRLPTNSLSILIKKTTPIKKMFEV